MSQVKIIRVNEQMCPCCGRGMQSGYLYPSCAPTPIGYTRKEAHAVFCNRFANDLCPECDRADFKETQP
jgi:RNA polymerase subunit RPABC4/transcription elongation factor Spt4